MLSADLETRLAGILERYKDERNPKPPEPFPAKILLKVFSRFYGRKAYDNRWNPNFFSAFNNLSLLVGWLGPEFSYDPKHDKARYFLPLNNFEVQQLATRMRLPFHVVQSLFIEIYMEGNTDGP